MNTTTTHPTAPAATRRLERPREGRVLAGVAAGIANRTGGSVALVRVGFIVTAFIAGLGALVYLAGWLLMPNEGEDRSLAQRWLDGLRTPGRRTASVLIGIAGLIVVAATAPVAALAALTVMIGAGVLASDAGTVAPVAADEVSADEVSSVDDASTDAEESPAESTPDGEEG